VKPATVDYALRDVDRELWTRVKVRAAGEGRSIRFVLIEFLKLYAHYGFNVIEAFGGSRKQ
jgi:hypothetical protein